MSPETKENDDRTLVALCCKGDRIAFDRLVLKYQHLVVGMCTRLLNSRPDGEDAAQECFVKVYRHIDRFSGQSSFSTWLYRIVINTCRNRHNSWWNRLRKHSVSLDAPRHISSNSEQQEQPLDIKDTRFIPVKDLERKQLGAALNTAIATLPQNQKEMVILRDIKGFSYEEIEHITGCTEGTVKSRLFRARKILQEQLKDIWK